jgi:hypothetical protein
MNESLMALAEGQAGGDYEALSEQMELESLRYSRSLPEEEEARLR